MHVDFGTGDGAFVRALAARHPDLLVIGVDAAADGLRAAARRVAAKPARGGLPNAMFGRLSLTDAPGELVGLADGLSVLLPWGSLLRAVARPEPAALCALRALCRPGAAVQIVFGYGAEADAAAMQALELPPLDGRGAATTGALEASYRAAGFSVSACLATRDDVRALPTTWAKRLAFSGRERRFITLTGQAAAA